MNVFTSTTYIVLSWEPPETFYADELGLYFIKLDTEMVRMLVYACKFIVIAYRIAGKFGGLVSTSENKNIGGF
jgi:hypothetical protein